MGLIPLAGAPPNWRPRGEDRHVRAGRPLCGPSVIEREVGRTPDDEVDGDEGWDRLTDKPDVRAVEAIRTENLAPWRWSVVASVAEFVREDPLETEFRQRMAQALRAVPGVDDVAEGDREV